MKFPNILLPLALTAALALHAPAAEGPAPSARAQELVILLGLSTGGSADALPMAPLTIPSVPIAGVTFERKTLRERPTGILEKIVFVDGQGKQVAFGKIRHQTSVRAARLAFIEELATGSMPIELLARQYQRDANGPGEICVKRKSPAAADSPEATSPQSLHFVRGNTVVSITAAAAGYDLRSLAEAIDGILHKD